MEYKKDFFEEDRIKKVRITAPEDSKGLWDSDKQEWVRERKYEVVDKVKLYEDIRKVNERQENILKEINLSDKYIKGFSLEKYREKYNIKRTEEVVLENFRAIGTFFDGGADFTLADFGNGHTSFGQATFNEGDVYFTKTCFGKEGVSFLNVNFGNGFVSFARANFGEGYVDFGNAFFGKGDINFRGAYFKDVNVAFIEANFGKGKVDFSHANFGKKDIDFNLATLEEGYLIFYNIKVSGDWDMRVDKVDIIDFSESRIYGNIDFGLYESGKGKNISPKVRELRLLKTKLYGKIHMDYDAFGLKDAIKSQNVSYREKRDQFRIFKENFHSLGQYDDEDKSYLQFRKHWLRDQAGWDETDSLWEITKKHPLYLLKLYLFEKIGLYGTSPMQVIKHMGIWVAIFSLSYWPLGNIALLNLPEFLPIWFVKLFNALHHSIITFLTIGYGSNYIYPTLYGRLLSGIEGFTGLFLMSYFTISFVRKVLR